MNEKRSEIPAEALAEESHHKIGGRKPPPTQERLSIKMIEAVRAKRRRGWRVEAIAEDMGISLATVSAHAKGIKPKKPDGQKPPESPVLQDQLQEANGGEKLPVETPKPTMIQFSVDLDAETMLMLAGTASVQGFPSLKTYLNEYAIPWLNTMREASELIGSKEPKDHMVKLNEIVAGYVQFRKLLAATGKKEEKPDVKN